MIAVSSSSSSAEEEQPQILMVVKSSPADAPSSDYLPCLPQLQLASATTAELEASTIGAATAKTDGALSVAPFTGVTAGASAVLEDHNAEISSSGGAEGTATDTTTVPQEPDCPLSLCSTEKRAPAVAFAAEVAKIGENEDASDGGKVQVEQDKEADDVGQQRSSSAPDDNPAAPVTGKREAWFPVQPQAEKVEVLPLAS
eukprot:COSAG05_NODE_1004_length_6231_cov_49.321429_3_plen_200_part_00